MNGDTVSRPDPRRVLGVGASATVDDVRSARRRLAKSEHPDAGGSAAAMGAINAAADELLADLEGRAPLADPGNRAPDTPRPPARHERGARIDHDVASFTIEALPVEAFEALLVVTSWIGELIVDEPPYQLDVALAEPLACWCRLDLVPDAGASTVAVTIASLPDEPLPDIDAVRDVWVTALNQLGAEGIEGS